MFRRRCKLMIGAVVICFSISFLCLYYYGRGLGCSNDQSIQYLESLCHDYAIGRITGSLCKPLCITKEITLRKCLGHGVKLHVLEAEWNGTIIVLKSPKSLGEGLAPKITNGFIGNGRREEFRMSTHDLVYHLKRHIYNNQAGEVNTSRISQVAITLAAECDIGSDGLLSFQEAVTCWQLATSDEYILYSLLHNNSAMLAVYGACGNMYAVQHAAAQPFLGYSTSLSDNRSWMFRAQLVVALLNMIEALEKTSYGTLHLCDVQESNFGLVRKADGSLVAKAIDVDIAMFENSLLRAFRIERNRTCRSDQDCFMISCGSKCNIGTGKCAGILTSSNLVTFCSKIFKQRYRLHPGLLRNPPDNIKMKLNRLLEKCSQYNSNYNGTDKHLLNSLKELLSNRLTS